MRRVVPALVLITLLAAGCGGQQGAGSSQRTVFAMPTGFSNGGPASIRRILNLGLPELHNDTSDSVRIRAVQLVGPGRFLHLLGVVAYPISQLHGVTVDSAGDLPKECPSQFGSPQPVTAAVTGPHSDSSWTVMIALRITRPGTYHINQVRIDYVTGGRSGWQYYNMYDTVNATVSSYALQHHLTGCAAASVP